MPIYTRTGDSGQTSLYGGKRVSKSDPRIEAYGSIDELSSLTGMVVSRIGDARDRGFLISIQRDFHKIMARLSGAKTDLAFLDTRVAEFEKRIDEMDRHLPRLTRFILPGGNETSSWLHILRVTCRRAERKLIKYTVSEKSIVMYLNRLSDLFFTLARKYGQNEEIVL